MRLLAGRSVAVRLAVSSLFWSTLTLVIAGAILSALYRQNTERSFDERLLVYANDLAADLVAPGNTDGRELGTLGEPRFDIPLSGWYWQVGQLGALPRDTRSSRSLIGNGLPRLAPDEAERPFGQIRKGNVDGPEGQGVRLVERDIDLGEDGRFVVRVAGPGVEIAGAQRRFTVTLVVTFLLLGGALGLSALLQIRFGLRPLTELGAAVAAVRQGDADRIDGDYPPDIAPLAQELNLLIAANHQILERARTQVGNLAHALKTPLSVIQNEADNASDAAAAQIREQAILMRHQVDLYLNRARAAALAGALGTSTDLVPVLEALVRTFGKIYGERGLSIELSVPAGLRFRGERQDLEEMIGNLVDNACKWADARVSIVAVAGPTGLVVEVGDDGPGLPDDARAEAVKRGRRLDETKPGSGLGLSIVSDLSAHYGGTFEFGTSPLGGTLAILRLPGGEGRPAGVESRRSVAT